MNVRLQRSLAAKPCGRQVQLSTVEVSSAGDANPTVVTVRYQWQGDRVARLDPPPPW